MKDVTKRQSEELDWKQFLVKFGNSRRCYEAYLKGYMTLEQDLEFTSHWCENERLAIFARIIASE